VTRSKLAVTGRTRKRDVARGEIEVRLYHRCRDCRDRLPAPVESPYRAFCCRGCYRGFYLKRCVVCENDKPADSTARRVLCRRPKCRSQYHRNRSLFAYPVPNTVRDAEREKSAHSTGTKIAQFAHRPWRIVAGPSLSASALRAATVPDGPDCQWTGGSVERIEAANARALEVHFDKLDSTAANHCAVCHRQDDLVDYKAADGRWMTTCREHRATPAATNTSTVPSDWRPCSPATPIDEDLSIPEFLRRGGGGR
jgi:hypothetical protein